MDRDRAIELLRGGPKGVEKWNRVRERGESIPDLTEANLSRCDLLGVILRGVRAPRIFLGGSRLDRADLSSADLRHADLPACRLFEANLREARLCGANLRNADVTGADLTGADLRDTILLGVDLSAVVLQVVDPEDIRASMRRLENLPLAEDTRLSLGEIVQKLDMGEVLTGPRREQAAACVNELTVELLRTPPDPNRVTHLLDSVSEIEPRLVADVSEEVFLEPFSPGDERAFLYR